MTTAALSDPLWHITDVARYLGCPVSSVYKMTAPKADLRIPHIRIAGRLRFRKADIDQWLELLKISSNAVIAKVKADYRRRHGVDTP